MGTLVAVSIATMSRGVARGVAPHLVERGEMEQFPFDALKSQNEAERPAREARVLSRGLSAGLRRARSKKRRYSTLAEQKIRASQVWIQFTLSPRITQRAIALIACAPVLRGGSMSAHERAQPFFHAFPSNLSRTSWYHAYASFISHARSPS